MELSAADHQRPNGEAEVEPGTGSIGARTAASLAVKDLHKSFGGLRVLSGISAVVWSGNIVAVIGPNGSGKTTLLNVITGHEMPDSGDVSLDDSTITKLRPDARARRGLARTFQQPRVFSGTTALENLMIGDHIFEKSGLASTFFYIRRSMRENRAARARAVEVLDLVGLPRSKGKSLVETLSLREQRAVELGRALMMKPSVLLLDEPTTGMDPSERPSWIAYMRDLRKELGVTLVIVEHSMQVVSEISDHVVVLSSGKLLTQGTASDVLDDPIVRDIYLGKSKEGFKRTQVAP